MVLFFSFTPQQIEETEETVQEETEVEPEPPKPSPPKQANPISTSKAQPHAKILLLTRAKEALDKEKLDRDEEKVRYLAERVPPLQLAGLTREQLQKLCTELHKKIEVVDEERYDIEVKVNKNAREWVVPELVGQAIATALMLVSLHWFVFLLNLPVAAWNMYRFIRVPLGNMGVFDPTEIHNRGQLKSHMKEAMIKLGFHLLCFFIYLYR
ncbi:UNVERIFIED_CONTAM: hypothetical protein FKN15_041979 [Acipenser sinensis]